MTQQPLLKKLDEAIERIRFLEKENEEAVARIKTLDSETRELHRLVALAESKADEILKPALSSAASKGSPEAPSTAKSGKGLQDLMQDGPGAAQADTRRRSP
ncbi:MAG: hypothetical protein FJ020_09690 [Chloroflexi bacterium]|nr:hypothetical protein [Chloroflexota bacterium]